MSNGKRTESIIVVITMTILIIAVSFWRFLGVDSSDYEDPSKVLDQIYTAQTNCKADKGFYSKWPDAGEGLVKQAMNSSGFDFEIETTDSGFIAYAGRYIIPRDLLNSSEKKFVPLFSIDQDSVFQSFSN